MLVQRFSRAILLARRHGVVALATLVAALLGIFIYRGRSELAEALALIGQISPIWILVLASLQALIVTCAVLIYRRTLRRLGHAVGFRELARIQLTRVLVGTITPLGGPPSLYVMVRELRRNHVPPGDALITASARTFATLSAFALIIPAALLLQAPTGTTIIAAIVLTTLLALMLITFWTLIRQEGLPGWVRRTFPQSLINHADTLRTHRIGPSDLVFPTLIGMLWHLSAMLILLASLLAIGYRPVLTTVLVGYVAGSLMVLIAPLFRGAGLVELAMALALQRAGVPAVEAVGAAILFRIGDLWMPVLGGALVQVFRLPLARAIQRNAQTGESAEKARALARLSPSDLRGLREAHTPDRHRNQFGTHLAMSTSFTGQL